MPSQLFPLQSTFEMSERRLEFYRERDRRTLEYGVRDVFDQTVAVVVGSQVAQCVSGQLAVLALVSLLARLHRSIQLQIPAVPLLRPAVIPGQRLDQTARDLARSIDPYIQLSSAGGAAASIGIGPDAPSGLGSYIGTERQVALIGCHRLPFDEADSPSLGACLAACLGASTILDQLLGRPASHRRVSAWNLREGSDASRGPRTLPQLDVGDVLQVGAGGVGSCLAYWIREFGVVGRWDIADGDVAVLHNTNRSLGLFPSDTDWFGGDPRNKAEAAAALCWGHPQPVWYDQLDHDAHKYDLVLPLANERAVRHQIACRGEPIILHATTSTMWEAQLHQHIPDRDDCISCRMPSHHSSTQFRCATVRVNKDVRASTDAALPFLSAAAGLLLLTGLFRLQFGELPEERHNLWALAFSNRRHCTRRAVCRCHEGCATALPPAARARIHAATRWSPLDLRSQRSTPHSPCP